MKRFPREPLYKIFPDFLLYIPDEDGVKNHHENAKLIFGEPQMVCDSDDLTKTRPYLVFLDNLKKVTDLPAPRGLEIDVDGNNTALITRRDGLVIRRKNYFEAEEVHLSPWEFRFLRRVMGRYC